MTVMVLDVNFLKETYAITYRWVEERDSNMMAHYYIYFIMEHNKISKMSIFFYIVIVIIIGVTDGIIYDLIKTILGL
jgi:hypothetical protein